jgi:hypothetical protein
MTDEQAAVIRVCRVCGRTRPIEAFSRRSSKKGRRRYYCKECGKNRELLRRFGVLRSEYDAILSSQGGRCAICRVASPATTDSRRRMFCVDHCHATGKVRGLLCINCNRGLGLLGDDVEAIRRALAYLLGC